VELAKLLMRIFSYVYHGLLGLFMLGLACLTLLSGNHNLRLEMLPWTGATLTYALLGLALVAILAVLLAMRGVARVVFMLWTVAVLVLMFRGFFLTPYRFSGMSGFSTAALLTLGALLSVAGGWFVFRPQAALKRKS